MKTKDKAILRRSRDAWIRVAVDAIKQRNALQEKVKKLQRKLRKTKETNK